MVARPDPKGTKADAVDQDDHKPNTVEEEVRLALYLQNQVYQGPLRHSSLR